MSEDDFDDLGIRSQEPLPVRLTTTLNMVLYALVLNPVMASVWGATLVIVLALLITGRARSVVPSLPLDILIVALAILFSFFPAAAKSFKPNVFARIFFGRPQFGRLSDISRSYLRMLAKCGREVELILSPEDEEMMKRLAQLDYEALESSMKQEFLRLRRKNSEDIQGEDVLNQQWEQVWKNRILETKIDGITFRDLLLEKPFAVQTIGPRIFRAGFFRASLLDFYEVAIVWLIISRLQDGKSLLPIVTVVLLFSFLLAVITALNYYVDLWHDEVRIEPIMELPPLTQMAMRPRQKKEYKERLASLREEYADKFQDLENKVLHPQAVVTDRYFEATRGYFARTLWQYSLMEYVSLLLTVAVSFGLASILESPATETLAPWYSRLSFAFLIIPVGIIAGHYGAFFILGKYFRQFVALVLAGLFMILLPTFIIYVWAGHLPRGATELLSATVAGIVASAATAFTLQMKKQTEERR